jgi:hypothetical protein
MARDLSCSYSFYRVNQRLRALLYRNDAKYLSEQLRTRLLLRKVEDRKFVLLPPEELSTRGPKMKFSVTRQWLRPSLGDGLFLCSMLLSLNIGWRFISDGDIFWHLLTGNLFLDTFKIPSQDTYSYTMAGTNWFAHEWGAEAIFAFFYRAMGLNGTIILSVLLVSLTIFFLYKFLIFRKVNPFLALLLVTFAGIVSKLHWFARPHLFSLLLSVAFLILLELFEREKLDHLKFLPLLMVLWVNLHAGFIFGLFLIAIYTSLNFLHFLLATKEREEIKRNVKRLGFIAIATLAATIVNPRGPAILLFPFRLTESSVIMNSFEEWMSPNFHIFRAAHILVIVAIAALALSKKKADIIEASVFLLLLYMSLYSVRYLSLFALLTAPMIATRWQEILTRVAARLARIKPFEKLKRGFDRASQELALMESQRKGHALLYLSAIALLAVGLGGGKIAGFHCLDFRADKTVFPVTALKFATENQIGGKMFNTDHWGGYILLETFPQQKVFYDGRSDMYGDDFVKDYLRIAKMHATFETLLEKYGVTWVIYSANDPLCLTLKAGGRWKLVYADGVANILLKDIPENRPVIEKYPNVKFLPRGTIVVDEDEVRETAFFSTR